MLREELCNNTGDGNIWVSSLLFFQNYGSSSRFPELVKFIDKDEALTDK